MYYIQNMYPINGLSSCIANLNGQLFNDLQIQG